MIVMNDFKKQWQSIQTAALKGIQRVGDSGWLILGEEVAQFEAAIAAMLKLPFAIGCANGLEALEIALRCLNIGPGDRVLTTPLSAFATTLAIVNVGAIPVFIDVDASGQIDLDLCEEVLQQHSIQCILPVHLYGRSLNLSRLAQLKAQYNLTVIEDCAQAILASYEDNYTGSVGDMAALSLYPTKNLGCLGDGGVIFTHSSLLASKAKALRDYGQSEKYVHEYIGFNSRLDELHAAILNEALLPRLTEFTHKRTEIATQYLAQINHSQLLLPHLPSVNRSSWHIFPVLVQGNRQAFAEYLHHQGIQTAIHYPLLISSQKALQTLTQPIEILTPLTQATYYTQHQLSLPIHPFLTEAEIEKIIDACNDWKS